MAETMKRPMIVIAGAVLLAGCATVSSRHMGEGQALDSNNTAAAPQLPAGDSAGIAYFLPRQLARVTATRASIDLDEKIKGVVSARGEVEAAEAAVAAANAAIRQSEDAIVATSGEPAAQAILSTRLATQREALVKATETRDLKKTALETAIEALRLAARTAGSRTNTGAASYKVTLKIELLPPSADPAQAYRLSPHHNPFRDDEHRLVVSQAGLLTSTEIIAVDRTADILVEIGTFVGAVTRGAVAPGTLSEDEPPPPPPPPHRCTNAPNELSAIVDFANTDEVSRLNLALSCFGLRSRVTGHRWPASTRPAPTSRDGVDGIVYRNPVEVFVEIERCVDRVNFCELGSTQWFPSETIVMALPQAGPISYVRQDAGFMTRTRYATGFKDGILITYDASRPSEFLQLAGVPMRVIRGVFDGASQILSLRTGQNNARAGLLASELALANADFALRVGQLNGQTSLTNAQIAALNSEYALRAAQIAGDTGLTNAQITALNAEFALRAAQLTGQTSLSNAQLALLNSQTAFGAGQINAQTGINNAQLAYLQSQGSLATGANTVNSQILASNFALSVAELRDLDRRGAMNRCIAQQMGLGPSIETCLVGY